MAFTGRSNSGYDKDGYGWAIAAAFAGQAAIFVTIAALATGGSSVQAGSQMSAGPAGAMSAPQSVSAGPDYQPLYQFSYQVAVDGQGGNGVFQDGSPAPAPSFTVAAGQDLTISLDVTVPPGQDVTDSSVVLWDASGDAMKPLVQTLDKGSMQSMTPGTQEFQLSWPGSAAQMQPGTQWSLDMYLGTNGQDGGGTVAQIIVVS
jgi:hypothetical protein